MPVSTTVREEFAGAVREALGDLTPNQASYKTGISDEYIRKMAHGRVPSEVIVERLAKGLDADLHTLRVAAGYEFPADIAESIELVVCRNTTLSDEGKRQIIDFARFDSDAAT